MSEWEPQPDSESGPDGRAAGADRPVDARGVLVELALPAGAVIEAVLDQVRAAVPDVDVDTDYAPVPMGGTADTAPTSVIVRLTVPGDQIPAMEALPQVVAVWPDTPVEPFGSG